MSELAKQPGGERPELPESLFPFEDRERMDDLAIEKVGDIRELDFYMVGMPDSEQLYALDQKKEDLLNWFDVAFELSRQKADTAEWGNELVEKLGKVGTGALAEFYTNYILPIAEARADSLGVARRWLQTELDERGLTVQGIERNLSKEPTASDLDGNFGVWLFMKAGLIDLTNPNPKKRTKITYARHPEYEAGKGKGAAVVMDIGKGDFSVVSDIKKDVASELLRRTGEEGEDKDLWVPLNPETAALILDHHGPESTPHTGSASRRIYETLVALRFLKPDTIIENRLKIIDAMDDKTYLDENYEYDPQSFAGLFMALVPDGDKKYPLSGIDRKTKRFTEQFGALMDASEGDPTRHLSEEVLREVGLWEKSQEIAGKLARARAEVERLKQAGGVRELPEGGYAAFDANGENFYTPTFQELNIADFLYGEGVTTRISKTLAGENSTIFVNAQGNKHLLAELKRLYGGDVIRNKMWILNGPQSGLPNQTELEMLLGLDFTGERPADPIGVPLRTPDLVVPAETEPEKPAESVLEKPWVITEELDRLYDRYRPNASFGKAKSLEMAYNQGLDLAKKFDLQRFEGLGEEEAKELMSDLRRSMALQAGVESRNDVETSVPMYLAELKEEAKKAPESQPGLEQETVAKSRHLKKLEAEIKAYETALVKETSSGPLTQVDSLNLGKEVATTFYAEVPEVLKEDAGWLLDELKFHTSFIWQMARGRNEQRFREVLVQDIALQDWLEAYNREVAFLQDKIGNLTKEGGNAEALHDYRVRVARLAEEAKDRLFHALYG